MGDPTADLVAELAEELHRLPLENAQRLAAILQELFASTSDLNQRISLLEVRQMPSGNDTLVN